MLERGEININAAKEVLALLFESSRTPEEVVEQHGFGQVSDAGELEVLVDKVLGAYPRAVEDFRSGKKQAMGFLVGQAMRASQGKANPDVLRKLLDAKLT